MNTKESTLGECLSAKGIRSLPRALKDGEQAMWVEAIVLVSKGGMEEYCLATNNGFGVPSITRDFGTCRAISRIISVHPIEILGDNKIIPKLKDDKAIITYLCKSKHDPKEIVALLSIDGKTAEQIRKDRETINKYIVELAMRNAKAKAKEKERVRNLKNYNGNKEENNQ